MTTEGITDFDRIFTPRKEKAIKAISLLENGAAKRYEATREDVLDMINEIQESLDAVREAYGITSVVLGNQTNDIDNSQVTTMTVTQETPPSELEITSPRTAQQAVDAGGVKIKDTNPQRFDNLTDYKIPDKDGQFTYPYYANIGTFVAGIPEKDMPNYVTHLTHRIYEDLAEYKR